MKLLRWLFGASGFERVPDAFILKRASLWPEIRKAIEYQQSQGNVVWMVAHFADQFFALQGCLEQWQLDYEIMDKPIEPVTMVELSRRQPGTVRLALAELLRAAEPFRDEVDHSLRLSILVIERHPMIDFDRQLETVVRQIPAQVKFGYYLALDDVAFDGQVSQSVVSLLKHFGLKEYDLINSTTTSRAIDRLLKKTSLTYDRTLRADSAAEWLALQQCCVRPNEDRR